MQLIKNIPQKNSSSIMPGFSQQQGTKVQVKKKPPSIKLQVKKLVKPQLQKTSTIKYNHSYNSSHHVSSNTTDHNFSVQKFTQPLQKNNKVLNFEQLYFQKIKQLKQQNKYEDFKKQNKVFIDTFFTNNEKNIPLSCKNSNTTKKKSKINLKKQAHSTKNYNSQGNKENQELQTVKNIQLKQHKFFRKQQSIKNKQIVLNHSSLEKKNKVDQTTQTQKVKRVLKLKKTNARTISNLSVNSSIQKQQKHQNDRQSLRNMDKPALNKIDGSGNLSEELNKFRLSTPSQSSMSKKKELSSTQRLIDQTIYSKIDHSTHQHIWGGVECFFSRQEFRFIMKQLGFDDQQDGSVTFYVRSLWQHLGGDLYGGIVKKNMIQLLSIILQDQQSTQNLHKKDQKINDYSNKTPLPNNFVESSSLKLIKFTDQLKEQLRTFYFSLRLVKIASKIKDFKEAEQVPKNPKNSPILSQKAQNHFQMYNDGTINAFEMKDTPKERNSQNTGLVSLLNDAYLNTISVKNRNSEMSPCMIPQSNQKFMQNNVTDFSPKMNHHQYEPFPSTILQKQTFSNQKLSTQLYSDNQINLKSNLKALLSIEVNLGQGIVQKIVVYEDQDPYQVSMQLKQRYNIDQELRQKFEILLKNHLKNLLFKIQQVSQELFQDSLQLKDQQNQSDFIMMEKQSIY